MADRHQFRAKWHDYNGGIYFVTICCACKKHLFGKIVDGVMHYSPMGLITDRCLNDMSAHTPYAEVWNSVIMPNHIHMVISIKVGAQYIAPKNGLPNIENGSQNIGCLKHSQHGNPCDDFHYNSLLAVVVRTFKAAVTRCVRAQCIAPVLVWQRSFHEHIIRNQRAYDNIMNYIDSNIENWCYDTFNANYIANPVTPASANINPFDTNIDNSGAIYRAPTSNHHEA